MEEPDNAEVQGTGGSTFEPQPDPPAAEQDAATPNTGDVGAEEPTDDDQGKDPGVQEDNPVEVAAAGTDAAETQQAEEQQEQSPDEQPNPEEAKADETPDKQENSAVQEEQGAAEEPSTQQPTEELYTGDPNIESKEDSGEKQNAQKDTENVDPEEASQGESVANTEAPVETYQGESTAEGDNKNTGSAESSKEKDPSTTPAETPLEGGEKPEESPSTEEGKTSPEKKVSIKIDEAPGAAPADVGEVAGKETIVDQTGGVAVDEETSTVGRQSSAAASSASHDEQATSPKPKSSILKTRSSVSQEAGGSPSKQEFYVDGSGNVRQVTPGQVNVHQFYPDLSATMGKSQEILADDEAEDEKFIKDASNKGSGSQEERPSTRPSRAESGTKTVHFDEAGPQVTEMDSEDREDLYDDDEGRVSVVSAETSDSISLPTTSRGPSRATGTSADLFTTQVDEETLEAAKIRQRRRTIILEPENIDPVTPVMPTMGEVVGDKAQQHFAQAMSFMKRHEYQRALTAFQKTLNLKPKEVETECYVQRGEAYLHLADFQSAILNYKRACVLEPDNYNYYSRLAFIYFFQGQCLFDQKLYPEALEAFSRAAEMRPEIVGYQTRSIACLAALQRHGECLALVNKRLETDEKNADLYIMRARLHELFSNTTLCYYDVKDALSLEPSHPEALELMKRLEAKADDLKQQAMHLNLMNRHRDALQKISIAIETNPSIADYHILRGALHRRVADFNAAIDDYLLALDKTDHNEESPVYLESQRQLLLTYNDFAVECFNKEFYEEAIILLNKAIKGEKREKGLYINRGDCFFRQAHMQFALADYHQALELDPIDDAVKSRIAIIHNEYGIQEYGEKNYKDAESRFSLAIQHSPRVGQYYISRARARQMMENISGARSDLLMALHLDPQNEDVLSMTARLFPGKTVKDVLNSRAAAATRGQIEHLLVANGPVKLAPLERQESEDGLSTQDAAAAASAAQMFRWGSTFPSLRACMEEREFHIKVVQEKKRANNKVKNVLATRKSLKHFKGRVQPLPPAAPYTRTSLPRTIIQKEKVMVNALSSQKPQGWRQFSMGIGLTGIPDDV